MNIKWYADAASKIAYEQLEISLAPFVAENFPGHKLSLVGFNRDLITEEVTIKLHIKPLGNLPSLKIEG